MVGNLNIRKLRSKDRHWVLGVVETYFHGPQVVSRGQLYETRDLPGLVAEVKQKRLGLLHYRIEENELEVVILIALSAGKGIGSALLNSAKEIGRAEGLDRLWLITTNDNLEAQRFYRGVGWDEIAVHRGALAISRALKPEIPLVGMHGIPLEDEIEFEYKFDLG